MGSGSAIIRSGAVRRYSVTGRLLEDSRTRNSSRRNRSAGMRGSAWHAAVGVQRVCRERLLEDSAWILVFGRNSELGVENPPEHCDS